MNPNNNSKNPLHGLWALTNRELKKWYKNPILFFMTIIQPIIWMGLFGKAMNISAIFTSNPVTLPPLTNPLTPQQQLELAQALSNYTTKMMENTFGTADYFSFMSVGILSFVVMFTTMFSGMSIVWDRRLGFLNKVLSTPVARGAILMSKVFAAVIRSLAQAAIILGFAFALGLKVGPDFTPLNLLGVFSALFLISIGLSSIFILIAIRSTRWETQMAVMNLLNMPLLFASNALFPTSLMPDWLQAISKINPITYATDATRQLILYPINMQQLLIDFTYLGIFATVFSTIGILLSWRYLSK
ncbi:MAG: ABC transporter permease [Candidatus Bathyarchaeia archaeon]